MVTPGKKSEGNNCLTKNFPTRTITAQASTIKECLTIQTLSIGLSHNPLGFCITDDRSTVCNHIRNRHLTDMARIWQAFDPYYRLGNAYQTLHL